MKLHFTLKSGRILLLESPLSDEEEAEANTDGGMAILEALADSIAARATKAVGEGDAEYDQLKAKHRLP